MAYSYIWLDQALEDLSQEIGYVCSEFGVSAARKAEAKIRERVNQLCDFPRLGQVYEGLSFNGSEVRVLHIRQVSVLYTFDDNIITLVAVWNNYQDPAQLAEELDERS